MADGSLGVDFSDNTLLVHDSSVKTGNCVLTIQKDGQCSIHKHKAGHLLYVLEEQQTAQSSLQFLECVNQSKTEAGQVCAFSTEPFDELAAGETVGANVVLLQGMVYCELENKLKIVFYKWKFASTSTTVRDVLERYTIDDALQRLFETKETVVDAGTTYLMYFNQFSGAKHAEFQSCIDIARCEGNRRFFQSSSQPDNWGRRRFMDPRLDKKYTFVRMTLTDLLTTEGVSFSSTNTADKSVLMGPNRKLAQRPSEVVNVLYCKPAFDGSVVDGFYLLPLPTPPEKGYKLLAPITKAQAKSLDDYCNKNRHMSTEALLQTINIYLKETNQSYIKVAIMEVNNVGDKINKFIVSVVKGAPTFRGVDHDNKKQKTGSEIQIFASAGGNPYIWCQQFKKNIYEYQVPFGVVIFQCFASIYRPILNKVYLTVLVCFALFGHGLKRTRTEHQGQFFIIGQRHSCQSNRSMSGYQQNCNQYSDKQTMDKTYLPLAMSLINALSDVAGKIHASSGAIMKSTAEKVRQKVEKIQGNVSIHHWVIITHLFCNTRHFDSNDYMHSSYFDQIWEHVTNCKRKTIVNYFRRYETIFPELIRKKQWPLSTTCCWVPTGANNGWVHLQYFVLIDFLLAFDLSSTMFGDRTQQLASTFYGSTFSHLTSKSLWVSEDGRCVSTSPVKKARYGLFAWGEYSGKSKQ